MWEQPSDRTSRRLAEAKAMCARAEIKIVYLTDQHPETRFSYEPESQVQGANAEGYGQKIATGIVAKVGNRTYRVYATHWSNSPSFWVTIDNQQLHIMGSELRMEQTIT